MFRKTMSRIFKDDLFCSVIDKGALLMRLKYLLLILISLLALTGCQKNHSATEVYGTEGSGYSVNDICDYNFGGTNFCCEIVQNDVIFTTSDFELSKLDKSGNISNVYSDKGKYIIGLCKTLNHTVVVFEKKYEGDKVSFSYKEISLDGEVIHESEMEIRENISFDNVAVDSEFNIYVLSLNNIYIYLKRMGGSLKSLI